MENENKEFLKLLEKFIAVIIVTAFLWILFVLTYITFHK